LLGELNQGERWDVHVGRTRRWEMRTSFWSKFSDDQL